MITGEHQENWAIEQAGEASTVTWEAYCDAVLAEVRHLYHDIPSLDGNQATDGYSLDHTLDMYEQRKPALLAAAHIRLDIANMNRHRNAAMLNSALIPIDEADILEALGVDDHFMLGAIDRRNPDAEPGENGTLYARVADMLRGGASAWECLDWAFGAIQRAQPVFWTVAVYLTDQAYGGPEEGGWWYRCGTRVEPHGEGFRLPVICDSLDAAYAAARAMNESLHAAENSGRRPISSVLSEGRYCAEVCEGWPEAHFPARRPHYE